GPWRPWPRGGGPALSPTVLIARSPRFSARARERDRRRSTMTHDLTGKHVAFLVADKGTEHIELVEPVRGVLEAGGETTLISMKAGKISTNNNDLEPGSEMDADVAFADAKADDYDAVVVPG